MEFGMCLLGIALVVALVATWYNDKADRRN